MPSLPLTELDERLLAAELDSRTFALTFAQPLPINDLLLLIVRGTSLSVVPDPGLTGSFMGELKNVTVRQALDLILPPLGLGYTVDGPVIRVFRREPETRLFDVNYIASVRTGSSRIGTDLNDSDGSYANVSTATAGDIFTDLERGVQTLLSERATFNVDRKAGLLQVTDFPDRLDRVDVYLETLLDHAHREVEIEAQVVEIELNDDTVRALDWTALKAQTAAAAPDGTAAPAVPPALRVRDLARFMTALAAQGTVSVVATPRLRSVNNEPAIVRASSAPATGRTEAAARSSVESFTLSVTPHIAPGGIVMLSLSPILTMESPAQNGVRVASTREADTLARVADGETIVLSGFGHERETTERRVTGATGGWFGRSTVTTRKHVEVLILLTPRILAAAGGQ
jgi:MSHA biogenesis protein MshL